MARRAPAGREPSITHTKFSAAARRRAPFGEVHRQLPAALRRGLDVVELALDQPPHRLGIALQAEHPHRASMWRGQFGNVCSHRQQQSDKQQPGASLNEQHV